MLQPDPRLLSLALQIDLILLNISVIFIFLCQKQLARCVARATPLVKKTKRHQLFLQEITIPFFAFCIFIIEFFLLDSFVTKLINSFLQFVL